MSEPKWMTLARADLGTRELPGARHNPKIVAYSRDAKNDWVKDDETHWCAAFVGAMLERSGIVSTRRLNARSYLNWGQVVKPNEVQIGDIVVFARGNNGWSGHVGFYAGKGPGGTIMVLGGNQSNAVTIAPFGTGRLLGYRRPIGVPKVPVATQDSPFERALKLIGPSIAEDLSVEEFAIFTKRKLTPENRGEIRAARNAASQETLRKIFWQNYWVPAGCEHYPADHAAMAFLVAIHHDANVARVLVQETVGTKVDSIIGPKSIAGVKNTKITDFVQKLADLSVERLKLRQDYDLHAARWLKDINDVAIALTGKAVVKAPTPKPAVASSAVSFLGATAQTEVQPMSDTPAAPAVSAPKLWHQSITIWGTIVTFASTVLPALGPLIGVDISGTEVHAVGSSVTQLIQAVGGVVGTVMAVYGRTKATAPVTFK